IGGSSIATAGFAAGSLRVLELGTGFNTPPHQFVRVDARALATIRSGEAVVGGGGENEMARDSTARIVVVAVLINADYVGRRDEMRDHANWRVALTVMQCCPRQ